MQKQTKSKSIDLLSQEYTQQEFNWACVSANIAVYQSGKPNIDLCQIPVPSNWKFDYLYEQLVDYNDQQVIQLLRFGFPLEFDHQVQYTSHILPNHKGATMYPDEMDAYIHKELTKGTMIGPFNQNPFGKRAKFSPMNTREKRDSTDRRVIMDLSFPPGASINDGIDKDNYRSTAVTLKLPNIFVLADKIVRIGPKARLFKRDLTGAFKQIPICIGDIHLLGFTYRGLYYFDITLPQGLSNSCYICQRVTDMIMYIYAKQGFIGINYLDDLGGAEHEDRALKAYHTLGEVISRTGAVEAPKKATPPSHRMNFLGTLLDAINMRLEVLPERLLQIKEELQTWSHLQHATIKQIQSIIGKLSFCAVAIRTGRVYFSRMLNFLREHFNSTSVLELTSEFRADINWWKINIEVFNGVSFLPSGNWIGPNILFSTDASLTGLGGWSDGEFFSSPFPVYFTHYLNLHITELEALAVMVGIKIWAFKASGSNFLLQCDNQATVTILNTGRTRNIFIQKVVREIHHICALNDCHFRAVHIPSNQNRISDALSRAHNSSYFRSKFQKIVRGWTTHNITLNSTHFTFTNPW